MCQLSKRYLQRALILLFTVLSCFPLTAKGWSEFKLNPDYLASYPENWYRLDTSSPNFNVNSKEAKEGETPANIQIRISELTEKEAAMNWDEFVAHQKAKHIAYLEDNWIDNPKISEIDTLSVDGASLAFHLRTDVSDTDEPYVLITDYAKKGLKLYLFRFYCPLEKFEKYHSDYYVMRAGFQLH